MSDYSSSIATAGSLSNHATLKVVSQPYQNLFYFSENVAGSGWTAVGATKTAPDTVLEATGTSAHYIEQALVGRPSGNATATANNTQYLVYCEAQPINGGTNLVIAGYETGFSNKNGVSVTMAGAGSISSNVPGSSTLSSGHSITLLADGWYAMQFKYWRGNNVDPRLTWWEADPTNSQVTSFAGDVTRGFKLRKVQLCSVTAPFAYIQSTTSATVNPTDDHSQYQNLGRAIGKNYASATSVSAFFTASGTTPYVSWTPTFAVGGGVGTWSPTSAGGEYTARYFRIGTCCFFYVYAKALYSYTSGSINYLTITLPVTRSSTGVPVLGTGWIVTDNDFEVNIRQAYFGIGTAADKIRVHREDNATFTASTTCGCCVFGFYDII